MEFLMTYGWAVLVVLAAIGALAYFGVLSPDKFLPEKCTLPSGIACLDFRQKDASAVTLVIQNAQGFDISGVHMQLDTGSENCSSATIPSVIDGQKATLDVSCNQSFAKGKFSGTIRLNYTRSDSTMEHIKTGQLIMRIE